MASTMLPNPFSDEEAQRYINEFKTWPHAFTPHQIVYAGFRAHPRPGYSDNTRCHFCGLEFYHWTEDDDALYEHLRKEITCSHAIRLQARTIAKEEAMKQLAMIAKQDEEDKARKLMEEAIKSNKQDLVAPHHDPSECDLHHYEEARLLHFFQDRTKPFAWHLSSPHRKGMPVDMALGHTLTQRAKLTDIHNTKLLQAITEVVGEGGIMEGWQIHAISERISSVRAPNFKANVLVVKKKVVEDKDAAEKKDAVEEEDAVEEDAVEKKDAVEAEDAVASRSETISDWSPTPDSSVLDESFH
ncbi:MAG: hypothetical protein Q9182_006646 [Xanthomendoza sp. 2 TL-2023]